MSGRDTIRCRALKYVIPFYNLVGIYKAKAKSRGLSFTLTEEELKILFQGNCFYCGKKPEQMSGSKKQRHIPLYIYNGIDRMDNNIGYISNNCESCCQSCNASKGTKSMKEFLKWQEHICHLELI